jgi:hypothetical protein
LKEQIEPEAYRKKMVKFQGKPRSCNIAVNISCRRAAPSLLLRFHAYETVSHPSVRAIAIGQNKTF